MEHRSTDTAHFVQNWIRSTCYNTANVDSAEDSLFILAVHNNPNIIGAYLQLCRAPGLIIFMPCLPSELFQALGSAHRQSKSAVIGWRCPWRVCRHSVSLFGLVAKDSQYLSARQSANSVHSGIFRHHHPSLATATLLSGLIGGNLDQDVVARVFRHPGTDRKSDDILWYVHYTHAPVL